MIIRLGQISWVSWVIADTSYLLILIEFAVICVLSSTPCQHRPIINPRSTLIIVKLISSWPLRWQVVESANDMISWLSKPSFKRRLRFNGRRHLFARVEICSLRLLGSIGVLGLPLNILALLGTTLLHLLCRFISQPLLKRGLLDIPVIHKIKIKSLSDKCFSEHAYQLLIVWFFFKFQFSGVIQKVLKLFGIPWA